MFQNFLTIPPKLGIPDVEAILDDSIEKYLTEDDWIQVKSAIAIKLGELDVFVEVSEPDSQIEDEETSVTISECLSDIYQDISDFIRLFQVGSMEIMNDAVWECKQNFEKFSSIKL